jgi:protocatechuate 3,4-dioxygenase beta subunit
MAYVARKIVSTVGLLLVSVALHGQNTRSATAGDQFPPLTHDDVLKDASSRDSFPISKYVIQGVVLDDQGAPVEGAALHIGRQLAYCNSSGQFLLRVSKRASYSFSVAAEESIANGVYQVISAPSEVHSESEESAVEVQVVVRRVPATQAKLYRD